MNESLFKDIDGLDAGYLDAAYGNDAETAAMVFDQFLQELPSQLSMLEESFAARDVESFRHHIHKQKPGFSYVGLTDVTHRFHELQTRCITKEDMDTYSDEIESVLNRIHSATSLLQSTLTHLQNNQ